MGLRIERVSDEAGARDWHYVDSVVVPFDHAGLLADPLEEVVGLLPAGSSAERVELSVGYAGARPVGQSISRLPLRDNTDLASVIVQVLPDERRRGYGRALLARACESAAAQGRRRVLLEVGAPLGGRSPGEHFAAAMGACPVLEELRRELDLASLDAERLARLAADASARADGYERVRWVDRAPADVVADCAVLIERMAIDTPMGGTGWQPELWDVARYREKEDQAVARGRMRVVTAARHVVSGRVVAYTDIGISRRQPQIAYQWDTIVAPGHRGRRLGLLVKLANLELLSRHVPAARSVQTWNAVANEHMVAINEALGFLAVERSTEWRLDLDAASGDVRPLTARP